MRRLTLCGLALAAIVISAPMRAQITATSTFREFISPTTTEFQAAIGRPVTSGVLDFYDTDLFIAGARNVLGTWGVSLADPGSVNRPTNVGSSNTMFATQLGEEVDIYGAGSDVVLDRLVAFSMISMDVSHLYSTAYSPFPLTPITFTVFGYGPSTGNLVIQQVFTIPAPPSVGGVQNPFLATLFFDSRWSVMSNVWWLQSTSSSTATQFANVTATLLPEPSTYAMVLTGLVGLGFVGVRKQRRKSV